MLKNWYLVERLNFQTKCRLYFPNKRLAILMEYNYTREFKQPHKIYSIKGVALPLRQTAFDWNKFCRYWYPYSLIDIRDYFICR